MVFPHFLQVSCSAGPSAGSRAPHLLQKNDAPGGTVAPHLLHCLLIGIFTISVYTVLKIKAFVW
jgi:hypothetical protein